MIVSSHDRYSGSVLFIRSNDIAFPSVTFVEILLFTNIVELYKSTRLDPSIVIAPPPPTFIMIKKMKISKTKRNEMMIVKLIWDDVEFCDHVCPTHLR